LFQSKTEIEMSGSFGKKTRPYEMKLGPIRPRGLYQYGIKYEFERLNDHGKPEPDLPILNFGTPAWMPGIVAPHERDTVEQNPSQLEDDFMERMSESEDEESMEFAKPPQSRNLCSLCNVRYEDYYLHINSDEHQERFNLNDAIPTMNIEAQAMQEEFQKELLKEFGVYEEASNNIIETDQQRIDNIYNLPTRVIRYIKNAGKENDQPSDSKKKITVRKIFYEDEKSEGGVQVEKVFNFKSQRERSPLREENKSSGGLISYNRGEQEEEHKSQDRVYYGHQSPAQDSILSSQHSIRNSQNANAMQVSTDVEVRESEVKRDRSSLKRKYEPPTENEVLNSLKKVKITDEKTDTSAPTQIKLVRGRLSNLKTAVSGMIGSLGTSIYKLWEMSFPKQKEN